MPLALLLALTAIAGAVVLTYFYDREALLWSRLCTGVCTGLALLGLVGFICASLFGMTPAALLLAGLLTGAPLLLLIKADWRARLESDIREGLSAARQEFGQKGRRWPSKVVVFYAVAAIVFWYVCDRTMYENAAGLFTGLDTNIGDLPFHLSVITGFAYGDNFPPQHPEYAGVPMTYPFITDFVTAMFVRAGASMRGAFFWQNYAMMLALAGLLHRWALRLTRDGLAAVIAPVLIFLSGGFGWWMFLKEVARGAAPVSLLMNLQHDYTITPEGYRWGNAITALFVPQRGILLGVALAILVWTLWLEATAEKEESADAKSKAVKKGSSSKAALTTHHGGSAKKRSARKKSAAREQASLRSGSLTPATSSSTLAHDSTASLLLPLALPQMLAAGIVAGLLPLVHAHSFVVTMMVAGCFALLQICFSLKAARLPGRDEAQTPSMWARLKSVALPWLLFFGAAMAVGAPQMLWATKGAAVQAGKFIGWEFGWDHGTQNIAWFWLKNTGFFIPLLVAALLWRGRKRIVPARALYFYLPFTLCFILPNVLRLAPWVWDNVKVLIFWWIASAPLVALLLARLWRAGAALRAVAVALLLMQVAAGGLDVWRVVSGATEQRTYDAKALRFAELIRRATPPRALILHAPTYNDPIYLTGRRTYLGYAGHLWSHGLNYMERENEVKRIYAGRSDAADLIARSGIEYVVVGPLEEAEMRARGVLINKAFFERYTKVGEEGEYRLYKTTPP